MINMNEFGHDGSSSDDEFDIEKPTPPKQEQPILQG